MTDSNKNTATKAISYLCIVLLEIKYCLSAFIYSL